MLLRAKPTTAQKFPCLLVNVALKANMTIPADKLQQQGFTSQKTVDNKQKSYRTAAGNMYFHPCILLEQGETCFQQRAISYGTTCDVFSAITPKFPDY